MSVVVAPSRDAPSASGKHRDPGIEPGVPNERHKATFAFAGQLFFQAVYNDAAAQKCEQGANHGDTDREGQTERETDKWRGGQTSSALMDKARTMMCMKATIVRDKMEDHGNRVDRHVCCAFVPRAFGDEIPDQQIVIAKAPRCSQNEPVGSA